MNKSLGFLKIAREGLRAAHEFFGLKMKSGHHWIAVVHEMNTEPILFAQQKQTNDGEHNASDSSPRWWFMKEKNSRDGHDRRAARQNCRNRREWSALLKKEKERDRAGTDANPGKQRITKTGSTEFLTPSSPEPENGQIDENRQRGTRFHNKAADPFTDALCRKTSEDLVRAVKHRSNDRIPEPNCHE